MVEEQGPNQEPQAGASPDEAAPDAGAPEADGESRSAQMHEWLAQLQQMIDRVAHEAAPVAKQVAAKAAELAAVAGEKAGPIAKRAAEMTEDVGTRVAERGRKLAADLRAHPDDAAADSPETPPAEGDQGTGL